MRAQVGVQIRGLEAGRGAQTLVQGVDLDFAPGRISAILGPSGCGKSVILRCINRLHEMEAGAWVRGAVQIGEASVYGPQVDLPQLRRRAGLLFAQPTLLRRRTIRENLSLGLEFSGRSASPALLASVLRAVDLWEPLHDRLDEVLGQRSAGVEQRLCLARALALQPQVLLLDEPCQLLDPEASSRLEGAIVGLKGHVTVLLATRDPHLAARVADHTSFLLEGRVVERGENEQLFVNPKDPRTENYLTGRFS